MIFIDTNGEEITDSKRSLFWIPSLPQNWISHLWKKIICSQIKYFILQALGNLSYFHQDIYLKTCPLSCSLPSWQPIFDEDWYQKKFFHVRIVGQKSWRRWRMKCLIHKKIIHFFLLILVHAYSYINFYIDINFLAYFLITELYNFILLYCAIYLLK